MSLTIPGKYQRRNHETDGVKDIIYHGKKQCFFIIVHGIDGFLADREFLRQIIHCEFQPFLIEDTQVASRIFFCRPSVVSIASIPPFGKIVIAVWKLKSELRFPIKIG